MELTIISRKEAIEIGKSKYFTGKPCKHGHLSERYTLHKTCIMCNSAYAKTVKMKTWMKNHNAKRRLDPEFIALEKKVRSNDSAKKRRLEYNKTEKMKEWRRKYQHEKIKNDVLYSLKRRLSTRIRLAFSKNGYYKNGVTKQMLGCDFDKLKSHIERQFLKGMNWENREKWHIDHITPLSSAKTEKEMIELNHYTNLRPIWANDNLSKGKKIEFLI